MIKLTDKQKTSLGIACTAAYVGLSVYDLYREHRAHKKLMRSMRSAVDGINTYTDHVRRYGI